MGLKLRLKSKVTVCLFLTLLLSILPLVTVVQAQSSFSGGVFIRSDGSIEPSSAPIQRSGEIYTFTGGFTGNITVQRDYIVLDGAGFGLNSTITGTETTVGVDLSFRTNVTVTNLRVSGFVQGIHLLNSTNCSLIRNIIKDDIDGIRFDNSTDNFIIGNNITANRHGTHPYQGNFFYHNNFVNSSDRDAFFDSSNWIDIWDNGYPSGGNYWSNYTGVDQKKGSSQSEAGSDGIGDSPFAIDANNTDRYPLIAPFYEQAQAQSPPDQTWLLIGAALVIIVVILIVFILIFRKKARN